MVHKMNMVTLIPNADLGGAAVAVLTEDSGAIGGTNDGDLPDLSTPGDVVNTAAVREVADRLNELILALQASGAIK